MSSDLTDQLVLSLFPGLDVLGMGFEAEGFCVVSGPDVIWGRDVREFHPNPGRFDGIIGGPPCQTFSALANLVRAKGLEPRFGNLIPEFVRIVEEASPRWWLMENVGGVPEECWPHPTGYSVETFVICNSWLDAGGGFGEEQMRKRRFWFGWKGGGAPRIKGRLQFAALMLPGSRQAVTHRPDAVPVKIGGSGKVKKTAVTGAHQCKERPKGGHGESYGLDEMLRLQGLPGDIFEHSPLTMQGKRKLVGNAVPLGMARQLARAIREVVT